MNQIPPGFLPPQQKPVAPAGVAQVFEQAFSQTLARAQALSAKAGGAWPAAERLVGEAAQALAEQGQAFGGLKDAKTLEAYSQLYGAKLGILNGKIQVLEQLLEEPPPGVAPAGTVSDAGAGLIAGVVGVLSGLLLGRWLPR